FLHREADRRGCFRCACCRVRCRQQVAWCPAYRKLRLFALACCRRVSHLLPDPVCRKAIQALEDYIEGVIDKEYYIHSYQKFDTTRRARFPKLATPDDSAWNAHYGAVHRRWLDKFDATFADDRWRITAVICSEAAGASGAEEKGAQSALLRDIVGNPFRPAAF